MEILLKKENIGYTLYIGQENIESRRKRDSSYSKIPRYEFCVSQFPLALQLMGRSLSEIESEIKQGIELIAEGLDTEELNQAKHAIEEHNKQYI